MDTETQQDPAYLCGRLLALLEQAQAAALGNPNTTLVDRFYGSASSTPASVFGLLLKNAQAHLSKLRHEREGAYHYLQRELGQIMEKLPSFPYILDLRKQGLLPWATTTSGRSGSTAGKRQQHLRARKKQTAPNSPFQNQRCRRLS